MTGISEAHRSWLDSRNIDPALAEKMGWVSRTNRAGVEWIVIPHVENNEVINRTFRRLDEQGGHRIESEADLTLINHDCLLDRSLEGTPVLICQRETDMLALMTAGKRRVVCLPNGAPTRSARSDDDLVDSTRYSWVWRLQHLLTAIHQFVFCVDDTDEGLALKEDLLRLLGAEKCRFLVYPKHCETIIDIAMMSPTMLIEVIDASKPYPIQGLYELSEFPEREPIKGYPIGISPIADMIEIVPATLTLFTGYANMGKSTVMNRIMAASILRGHPVCVFSGETDIKPILRDHIRAAVMETSLYEMRKETTDTSEADALMERNIAIIMQDVDEDEEMTLERFLELAETAVLRKGVKLIVLDPWNELEHKMRRDETVDQYISRAIRMIKRFMRRLKVAFWIIVHPKNPIDGVRRAPGLYDVAGGAMWANKADYGLTYHRPKGDENKAELAVVKVRMGLPGRRGKASVFFNHHTSNFDFADSAGERSLV